MLGNIGLVPLLIIILIALLMFGPSKLPELGRAFGKTLREFKKGAKEVIEDEEEQQPRKEVGAAEVVKASADDESKNRRLPD